jgi:hypothetical protein
MEGCAMSLAAVRWTTLVTILGITAFCLCGSGCSYFQSSSTDEDIDLTEVDEPDTLDVVEEKPKEMWSESPLKKGTAEPRLKIGNRFPLLKTVEHRLTQTDKEGSHVSSSRAEIMMSLVVETVLPDGRKQIAVRYQRIRYEQDIQGNRIVYSSDQPAEQVPQEALLYSGLVNNGFSYWIGSDNKIIEVREFNEFLQRCLRNVPAQHQATLRRQLESTKGEGYIASFIDDSIGMIPYDSNLTQPDISLKTGATWELEPQTCESPIPMVTNTRCVLKDLSTDSAEVLLTGRISGSPNPFTIQNPDGDFKVLVKGGHSSGACRVDRKTGFPTDCRIQRSVELVVELPDGQRIQQIKETLSTLAAIADYPQKSGSSLEPQAQQSSFQTENGGNDQRRVVRAGGFRQN